MEKSGYGIDGIYRSLCPPINLPSDPNLSMISFLFRNSSSYPEKPALIDSDSGETLTFAQLKSTVYKVTHGFQKLGITKNDVVLIFAPNSIQFPLCFFGIIATGGIATTVNPMYTFSEVSKQVKDCNPKLIITVPELWKKIKGINLPVVLLGSEESLRGIESNSRVVHFPDLVKNDGSVLISPKISSSDTAALLYSSGTTGVSKGVCLTHRNFIAAALMIGSRSDLMGEMHGVYVCFLPMFHVFGLSIITYAQLQRGNAVVSMEKFELEGMCLDLVILTLSQCNGFNFSFGFLHQNSLYYEAFLWEISFQERLKSQASQVQLDNCNGGDDSSSTTVKMSFLEMGLVEGGLGREMVV